MNRSFPSSLAAVRTRSSPEDTLTRLGVRRVLARPVFSSVPSLGSTGSGFGRPTPFAGFPATMEGSDVLTPVHHRLRLITFPMWTRARPLWPDARSPGSRAGSVRTCWGLRPRRAGQALALARLAMLPSTQSTVSAFALSTPCRSPGARIVTETGSEASGVSDRMSAWAHSATAAIASRPRSAMRTTISSKCQRSLGRGRRWRSRPAIAGPNFSTHRRTVS